MKVEQIDLSRFPNGATLDITFNIPEKVAQMFMVFVWAMNGKILYHRLNDRARISINLPKIPAPGSVVLAWDGSFGIKQKIVGPLRVTRLKYKHNDRIRQVRPYKQEDIRISRLPYIPDAVKLPNGSTAWIEGDQPGRFFPNLGEMQLSDKVLRPMPEPCEQFVIEHEKGHYHYGRPVPPKSELDAMPEAKRRQALEQLEEDEIEADRYAMYNLINSGYNFTSTLYALTNYLPPTYMSKQRILRLYNDINRINKNLH